MESPVRIALKGVGYRYPSGATALSGIDLEIRRGEFIGVLGANGSGKTTLLNVIDGLLSDYEGSVELDGKEINKLSARDVYRVMGLVFQNPDAQLFGGTVGEDVAFGLQNMGFTPSAVSDRVAYALESVQMGEFTKANINHLSYGQK